jgi:hypothetical protein
VADLVVVVEGQGPHFAVVRVSVFLGDVLQGTVGDMRIAGDPLLILLSHSLAQHPLGHLPQSHGTVPGPWGVAAYYWLVDFIWRHYIHEKLSRMNKSVKFSRWQFVTSNLILLVTCAEYNRCRRYCEMLA